MFYDIIERVKNTPQIWQSNHPHHRNRREHNVFWKQLAKELDADELRVRRRWKHLLDQYRKELKRSISKQIPDEDMTWEYFTALSFLKDEIMQREKDRAVKDPLSQDDSEESEESEKSENMKKKGKIIARKIKFKSTDKEESCQADKLTLVLKRIAETKSLLENKLVQHDDVPSRNDPDYMFLMSLLPYMKQLSEVQMLQFRSRVSDWILEAISSKPQI